MIIDIYLTRVFILFYFILFYFLDATFLQTRQKRIYKWQKTRYNTITELQYVIRQPEFRPKVQKLLLSDDGLIAIGKQIKNKKTLCILQSVFFVFILR